jgi:redox-sensing transcriptional repressor
MIKSNLPQKTVERLSQYRRALLNYIAEGKTHIYSHQLSQLIHNTHVKVRRDLMLIGHSGSLHKGYRVSDLIIDISLKIDPEERQKIILVGVGNLGRAIINYLKGKRTKLEIVAVFDNDPQKISKVFSGVTCFAEENMAEIIAKENIRLAILTVPPEQATHIATNLIENGIKGIINLTSTPLLAPEGVFLEEYDIITSLEKTVYFTYKTGE